MYTKTARQILRITFCYNLILLIFEAYHKHGKVRGETPVFREEVIPMGEDLFEIVADSVIVEVTDPKSGKVYRRELPIDYYENANFLRLRAENMDGSLSQLVFYTPRGIERVKDITGKGPDHDRCGGHGHE